MLHVCDYKTSRALPSFQLQACARLWTFQQTGCLLFLPNDVHFLCSYSFFLIIPFWWPATSLPHDVVGITRFLASSQLQGWWIGGSVQFSVLSDDDQFQVVSPWRMPHPGCPASRTPGTCILYYIISYYNILYYYIILYDMMTEDSTYMLSTSKAQATSKVTALRNGSQRGI